MRASAQAALRARRRCPLARRPARRRSTSRCRPASPEHSLPAARIFYWIEAQAPEKASGFAKAAYRQILARRQQHGGCRCRRRRGRHVGFRPRARVAAGMQRPGDQAQARLGRTNRRSANGVFGSPFIIVDGEPFWGGDRLDAVAERLGSRRNRTEPRQSSAGAWSPSSAARRSWCRSAPISGRRCCPR